MTRPRLLIFDFDGTALGGHEPYGQFPEPFCELLDRLAAVGIAWATATTWDVNAQWEVIRNSAVSSRPALLVGQTSRQAARVIDGELVIDEDHAMAVAARDALFRQRVWPRVRLIFRELLDRDLVERLSFDSIRPQCLIEVSARPGQEEAVGELLESLVVGGDYYNWSRHEQRHPILLPCHMTKAASVRLILEHTGIEPAATIVAGDGCNDLPMFDPELAGYMVCPANAEADVQARIRTHGGIVAAAEYSWGVVEAVESVLALTR